MMRNHSFIVLSAIVVLGVLGDLYGCSAVCLNKKGQVILGNNMDWISGDGMVVVNKRHVKKRGFWYENKPDWTWTSKFGSISFNLEGREFAIRGMNEAGLAITELMLSETKHPSSGGLPVLCGSQWIQYQLDMSATVKDVLASDKVVRIEPTDWEGMASHFLVCDKSGTVVAIEWLDGKRVVYTDDTLPIPALVNSAYQSCLTTGDDRSGRFKPMADLYKAYDTNQSRDGISYVFSMLESARLYSPPFETRWSLAFDANAMRITWKTQSNNQLRYVDFKDFDFSCQTAVKILDINDGSTGDVYVSFMPYTVEFNRKFVTRIYALYNEYSDYLGQEYSQEKIDGIIAFPESTLCVDGD
ncbi:MAG: linear amide C-N hydrolase [Sedimentisphaerales bacterium]|nr:linear amide C-N hydrolase [Sedimentisphaerales bacterium]